MSKIIKFSEKTPAIQKVANAQQPVALKAEDYLNNIKRNPLDKNAYVRLMIMYRKAKNYKAELTIINKGIAAFESIYTVQRKIPGKKVATLSKQLNKILGLVDAKGKNLFQQEPIRTWKRRKELLLKNKKLNPS